MSARVGEKAALRIIGMVLDSGAFFNIALDDVLSQGGYSEKDRAAASAIARDVIENKVALDYALGQVTDLRKCKKPIRNILRIGASRMLYTGQAKAAAVSSAVDICRGVGKGAQAGYVNAVLRALSGIEMEWPDFEEQPARHMAIKYSWPEWYCRQIIHGFGLQFALEYLSYREHMLVSLRVNPKRASRDEIVAETSGKPSPIDINGILCNISNAAGNPGYKAGRFSIQGQSSMLAARQALEDGLVLDLCAAPGGKCCYIAERINGKVIACDIHPHRLDLIRAQAARLGLDNIEVLEHDARQPLEAYIENACSVLVDAPCTGLGTAISRPDVKLNKTLDDAKALAELQYEILTSASRMVKPGGRLVYCTCTPTPIETDDVTGRFLSGHPNFIPEELELPDGIKSESKGVLRLWPHKQGTDAFYICRMVKL